MASGQTYRIVGVDKETHEDVDITVRAVSQANAKVKAELRGIIVTEVLRSGDEPTMRLTGTEPVREWTPGESKPSSNPSTHGSDPSARRGRKHPNSKDPNSRDRDGRHQGQRSSVPVLPDDDSGLWEPGALWAGLAHPEHGEGAGPDRQDRSKRTDRPAPSERGGHRSDNGPDRIHASVVTVEPHEPQEPIDPAEPQAPLFENRQGHSPEQSGDRDGFQSREPRPLTGEHDHAPSQPSTGDSRDSVKTDLAVMDVDYPQAMFCKRCRAPLGIHRNQQIQHCPACGLVFNPDNPRTYRDNDRSFMWILLIAAGLLVIGSMIAGVVVWQQDKAADRAKLKEMIEGKNKSAATGISDATNSTKTGTAKTGAPKTGIPGYLTKPSKTDSADPSGKSDKGGKSDNDAPPALGIGTPPAKPMVKPNPVSRPATPTAPTMTLLHAAQSLVGPWALDRIGDTRRVEVFHVSGKLETYLLTSTHHEESRSDYGQFELEKDALGFKLTVTSPRGELNDDTAEQADQPTVREYRLTFPTKSQLQLTLIAVTNPAGERAELVDGGVQTHRYRRYDPTLFNGETTSALKRCKQALDALLKLDVAYNEGTAMFIGADDAKLQAAKPLLQNLFALHKVVMRRGRLTDDALASLKGLDTITEVDLSYVPMTAKGINHLTALPNLTKLTLDSSTVTNDDMATIAKLANLEELDVSSTTVTDDGIKALQFMKKLRTLIARDTQISPTGVNRSLPHLTKVQLGPKL